MFHVLVLEHCGNLKVPPYSTASLDFVSSIVSILVSVQSQPHFSAELAMTETVIGYNLVLAQDVSARYWIVYTCDAQL